MKYFLLVMALLLAQCRLFLPLFAAWIFPSIEVTYQYHPVVYSDPNSTLEHQTDHALLFCIHLITTVSLLRCFDQNSSSSLCVSTILCCDVFICRSSCTSKPLFFFSSRMVVGSLAVSSHAYSSYASGRFRDVGRGTVFLVVFQLW